MATLNAAVIVGVADRRREAVRGVGLVLVIAVVGLFIVKWQPYYLRAFTAAANHSIGSSIVTGTAAAPPAASLQAAFDYARQSGLSSGPIRDDR